MDMCICKITYVFPSVVSYTYLASKYTYIPIPGLLIPPITHLPLPTSYTYISTYTYTTITPLYPSLYSNTPSSIRYYHVYTLQYNPIDHLLPYPTTKGLKEGVCPFIRLIGPGIRLLTTSLLDPCT